jgi:4-alpha-glucanotransferase
VHNRRKAVQARAHKSSGIDRDGIWAAKRKALYLVYRVPLSAGRQLAFEAYKQREGTALDDFATWCALAEKYGGDWRKWPAALQHPANPEVAEFAEQHPRAVDFHRWMQ